MMDGTWNRLVLMAGRLPGSSETSQGWSAEKRGAGGPLTGLATPFCPALA